ncbi:hypothetical protein CR513_57099, partial [Mucuna pruriens]
MLCTKSNAPNLASDVAGIIHSPPEIPRWRMALQTFHRIPSLAPNKTKPTTRSRFERRSSPLLMRRRANQRGEGAFHPLAFDSDSDERVLHRGPAHVEPVRRERTGRRVVIVVAVFVETAPERTGMRRRGTHTRSLLDRDLAVIGDDVARDGPIRGDGAVEGEPDGRRGRMRGA